MPAACPPALFGLKPVERRKAVAGFDGGIVALGAERLLPGQLGRGLGPIRRMIASLTDRRHPRRPEHRVKTLIGRRVSGWVPSHGDINDRHKLRDDPVFAVLTCTLEGERSSRAPKAA